jgi:hypothetical protein
MVYPRQELDIDVDRIVRTWCAHFKPVSRTEMLDRVSKFGRQPQSERAFMDAVIPGHSRSLMGACDLGAVDPGRNGESP